MAQRSNQIYGVIKQRNWPETRSRHDHCGDTREVPFRSVVFFHQRFWHRYTTCEFATTLTTRMN